MSLVSLTPDKDERDEEEGAEQRIIHNVSPAKLSIMFRPDIPPPPLLTDSNKYDT